MQYVTLISIFHKTFNKIGIIVKAAPCCSYWTQDTVELRAGVPKGPCVYWGYINFLIVK